MKSRSRHILFLIHATASRGYFHSREYRQDSPSSGICRNCLQLPNPSGLPDKYCRHRAPLAGSDPGVIHRVRLVAARRHRPGQFAPGLFFGGACPGCCAWNRFAVRMLQRQGCRVNAHCMVSRTGLVFSAARYLRNDPGLPGALSRDCGSGLPDLHIRPLKLTGLK